jgi:hypothetical protein
MTITLCTLFEGNYHYGVAALSNSLIASGFEGDFWVGYRGELPAWIVDAPDFDRASGELRVAPTLKLHMVEIDTPLHFAYYKPTFLRQVFERHAPEATVVAYLDPDIVLKCKWPSFAAWFTDDGISLCEDVNPNFPQRHPKRLQWRRFFESHGVTSVRGVERYYNSGFIGVPRAHMAFLDLWSHLCDLVVDHNKGVKHLKAGDANSLFHSTDQDALNFALTVSEVPLNTAGPEAMDFMPGGYYLSHAIGWLKPWRGQHIRQALLGMPPSPATKAYFNFANHPIKVFGSADFVRRVWSHKLASAIGRFYRRD